MEKIVKTAIAAVAVLFAAEILAVSVNAAVPAEPAKVAAKGECYQMTPTGTTLPCSIAYKDFNLWFMGGKDI